MARLPRLALAGEMHHVLQRGHNAQPVFIDADDRGSFVALLHASAAAEGVAVHGYCLLDAEIELLVTPQADASLSRMMQTIARSHGARMNRRLHRHGTLWAGRFGAAIVDARSWALRCLRYIETAAVRSGSARSAGDYAWSSAPHHLGLLRDARITEHRQYWALGNTPFERESAWRAWLDGPIEQSECSAIRNATLRNWTLGDDAFRKHLGDSIGRPLAPRRRGRPAGAHNLSPK